MKVKVNMTKTKLNIKKVMIYIILPVIILILLSIGLFFFMISPVGKDNTEITLEVKSGETYSSIATILKNNNLIKSDTFFKLYIKLNNISHLEAGHYKLNKTMNIIEIVKILSKGESFNPDAINLTIPEGRQIERIASYVSEITGKPKEAYLNTWNSDGFINNVIKKYWFITDEVKNTSIRYALEGYFFPSTYELLNKNVSAESIAYRLLDQMEKVLNKYKEEIESSEYTVHEILTLASIVEYEALLDVDRPIIAGVFYNRLNDGWKLQSCATACYAANIDNCVPNKVPTNYNSPYNTYYYTGLPVGPGNSPSEKSIIAVLNPTTTDYYYFMSDVCIDGFGEDNKVYYSKTIQEHNNYVKKYLTCF